MSNDALVFLNGRFLPKPQATLSLEDRAAMFADGVYDVVRYFNGRGFRNEAHVERLRRSLREVRIAKPPWVDDLAALSDELMRLNGLRDAAVYWQVSRGAAERRHGFPHGIEPTMFMIAYPARPLDPAALPQVKTAITAKDERWHRCDIKSLMLLPNQLARQAAADRGAADAVMHRDGRVTEGTSSGVFIVRGGELRTHPANQWILGSITRSVLIDLARKNGIVVREEPFTVDDLLAADEVFTCSTVTHVMAIGKIDDQTIGDGGAGPITRRLHDLLIDLIVQECAIPAVQTP